MDDHLDFEYGVNTEVDLSCGASLHGEMYVIGGVYIDRQVCIIDQIKFGHLSADSNNDIQP